jgi:hypothetical protein
MEYTIDMGPDSVIYKISFIDIGLGIQNLLGRGIRTQTHRQRGNLINTLFFSK